jgi:hypothetical protein
VSRERFAVSPCREYRSIESRFKPELKMATKIDKTKVSHVLLSDGKWQDIVEGSFDVGDVWPWQQDGDTRGAQWVEAGDGKERRVFSHGGGSLRLLVPQLPVGNGRSLRSTSTGCCRARDMKAGVFCFNPPYGVRLGNDPTNKKLLALYTDMGRAFGRFPGWRAACFVANPHFVGAFGHRPVITKPASNADLRGAFLTYEF